MTGASDDLEDLRDEIDRLDEEIAALLAERIHAAAAVARVKSKRGVPLVDEAREDVVTAHYAERFREHGLDGEVGRTVAEHVIDCSLERERAVQGES